MNFNFSEKEIDDLEQYFYWGLYIDGEHHKQWCLVKIAELLDFPVDLDEDERGIAP